MSSNNYLFAIFNKINTILKSKKLILFHLILVCTSIGYAQIAKIDSLKIELLNHPEKDTIRVQILNQLAYHHYRNDPPKSIEYADEAGSLASDLKFISGIARNFFLKGVIHMEQSSFMVAETNIDKAIQLYESIKDEHSIANCKNGLGVLYFYQGDNRQALVYYREALALKEKLGIKNNDGLLYNIGNILLNTGEYDKALANFEKALVINEKADDFQGILNCLNSIADLYYVKGNYPIALKYYNESLQVAKNASDSIGIFQSFINTGNLYRMQNQNDKALQFYNKALSIKKAHYNVKNITALKNNIAGIFYDNEEFETAIKYFKESVKLCRNIGDDTHLATALNGLGFTYFEMDKCPVALSYFTEANSITLKNNQTYDLLDSYYGLSDSYYCMGDYDLALKNATKLAELAEEYEYLVHQNNAYFKLSEIYKTTKKYKKALESHEKYKAFSDSLFNEENIEKIANLEYEYKYKQQLDSANIRELQLASVVKTTSEDLEQSQKNYLRSIISFLLVSIVLGGIILYLRFRNIKTETQNIIMEQKLLRSQMTPHFVFNSLSVLQGMILNKEEKKSVTYLSKFSKLLRIILENSRDKTVSLSQELSAIENYLSLQNLADESYNYAVTVADNIDVTKFEIPAMLIQPFAENAIEHAFTDNLDNRQIEILLQFVDKKLICTITDNGIGINSQKQILRKDKKSLATTITSERLKILSKDFRVKGSVNIEDRQKFNDQGTIVTLEIPYKLHDK
ncbi:MAG: tetratricopeptide repeat protein [Crocinitomicaceae bacterium]